MSVAPSSPLILYVDDERPNRIVFEQSLGSEFRIRTAPDARSGLAILEAEEVAVLITDIRMPEMTGDDLLRIVKERWPGAIRMVITAYSDIEPILGAINEGLVARYLLKPWQRDELVQLLRWGIEAWSFGKESAALQRRLLETERLATLGSIAGAVVHDLNQPLTGLVINADRLKHLAAAAAPLRQLLAGTRIRAEDHGRVADLADELTDLARDLHENAVHLRNVTDGLSQFLYRRPAENTPPPETDPLPLVKNAITVCHELAMRARGLITYDGPHELPRVRMAATELTQVLINLVANAAQALTARNQPGGRVVVTVRVDATLVTFRIRDDGIGMSPEVLGKVGTPFFTTRKEGIGLGLAQVQRLIGKCGGTFKLESQLGAGTTVSFAIPVAA
jgi:two-component system, sensor histidine kinase and response regulator